MTDSTFIKRISKYHHSKLIAVLFSCIDGYYSTLAIPIIDELERRLDEST
jgi:hypothetical protein